MNRLSNRRLKEIRSLTQRKYRDRSGETLVEGVRAVGSALDAGADVREVLVTESVRQDDRLGRRLEGLGERVHLVDSETLDGISDVEASQGIVAVVGVRVVDAGALGSRSRVLLLDGLGDPGNAGTLIRTAAWFGIEAVVTGPGTVDLYNPKVVRSSMGGLWDVDHIAVDEPSATLGTLKAAGFRVYGADMHGAGVDTWSPSAPSVLVLGNEAHGLSAEVRRQVDERVLIPGRPRRGGTESLNVAVAAGILMYEWTRDIRQGRQG